jgi:probable HAF family extracellular repeat protein
VAAPPVYHLELIPRLPEMQVEDPRAINNKGDVVGVAYHNNRGNVCFKYSGGVTIELPRSVDNECLGINDRGFVIGHTAEQAYLWKPSGEKRKIRGMKWAHAINRAGHVAGTMDLGGFDYHGALYADGQLTDLGVLDGTSTYSEAYGLNDNGEVVGIGDGEVGFIRGVHWHNGTATPIVHDGITTATAINNKGHIVGTAGHDSTSYGAYLQDEAGLHMLPTVNGMKNMHPNGINERDEIVGTMRTERNHEVAFYAHNGKAYKLYNLLDDESKAAVTTIKRAWAINDAGQIVGLALRDGRYVYPFIATPVTPPVAETAAAR